MSTAGRLLLSSLVAKADLSTYLRMGLEPHLFKEGELILYDAINDHLGKFGKLPHPDTIEAALPDSLVDTKEPPKFYLMEVEKRYLHNRLKAGVQEISALLTEKNQQEALEVFTSIAMELHRKKHRKHVVDFRDAQEIVYKTYVQMKSNAASMVCPYGWPALDAMSGGMRPGDFVTIVGRPMMGKTFLMLFILHHAWRHGRTPLLVSKEMDAEILVQRLTAMDAKVKLTQLLKAELSTKAFNSMMEHLTDLKQMQKPLHIVDGSVVKTIDDLELQCNILQPDLVGVDSAWLLEVADKRMGKFEKQGHTAELMKQRIATDLALPCMASYQFTKGSVKDAKKKTAADGKQAQMGMEDVYGSDYMAQLSTVMLALFESETDIEAAKRRLVRILKGRNGEIGSFPIHWDFSAAMDFSEIKPESTKDMQLAYMG